jgi:hypothetical protein
MRLPERVKRFVGLTGSRPDRPVYRGAKAVIGMIPKPSAIVPLTTPSGVI